MAKARLLKRENERHKRAFEVYCALGLKRSYQVVASKLDVSLSTVKHWARSFNWRERIVERDAAITRHVIDQSFQEGTEENERNLKIVRAALMRSVKDIAAGKVAVKMRDLAWLIPLEQRLMGIPDSAADRGGGPPPYQVHLYLPDNNRDNGPESPGQDDPGAGTPSAAKDSQWKKSASRRD